MVFDIPTFVFTIINLVVLYIILKRILFKPVTEFMEKRADSIRESLDKVEREKSQALEIKAKYEDELKKAEEQAERIIKEANKKAQVEYENIIKSAKAEAENIRLKLSEEMEIERNKMIKEIKNQVVSLALEAATKVIEVNMNTEANNRLVNEFIDEKGIA
ncbi:MAG: F0F1 ATP synthase subunit B [Clostridiaceae bacterium]|nr:F0F1 ATP synthase subunit B [Clostridiaceae bacterium]